MNRNDRQHEHEIKAARSVDHRTARDIALLTAGLGIGSGIALLLAPTSGEETRHTIGRSYRKGIKSIGRHTEDLLDRAEELLDHVHELSEHGSGLLHLGFGNKGGRRAA